MDNRRPADQQVGSLAVQVGDHDGLVGVLEGAPSQVVLFLSPGEKGRGEEGPHLACIVLDILKSGLVGYPYSGPARGTRI